MVIQSEDGEGYFVFVDSEQLTLENLTLEGSRNFEGALVVNGGSCHLNNVHLKCDPITRGKCFSDNLTKFGETSIFEESSNFGESSIFGESSKLF